MEKIDLGEDRSQLAVGSSWTSEMGTESSFQMARRFENSNSW